MKTVNVVAAIIERDGTAGAGGKSVFATQRGYGDYAGGWEFPGGKVEPGETPEEALVREIREELAADVIVERFVYQVEHDYETFHLSMGCYLCKLASDHVELLEHSAARWLDAATIDSVGWLPADAGLVEEIKRQGIV